MNENGYLPFTGDEFMSFIEHYNLKIWPFHLPVILLGLLITGLVFSRKFSGEIKNRIISTGLGILWLWNGIVFHLANFSELEPAAVFFGLFFIFQGIWFLATGGVLNIFRFEVSRSFSSLVSLLLLVYSLAIYPLTGWLAGQRWPGIPLFGVFPCPTVVFTFGLLGLNTRRMPRGIILIPVLWSIIALGAAVNFGIPQDYALPLTALMVVLWFPLRKRQMSMRIKETDEGIQDPVSVEEYDRMQKGFRDRGILEHRSIIAEGIDSGLCLELGPGPGYLGLEWLNNTENTQLIALEISSEMLNMAERNSKIYALEERASYISGSGLAIPLEENSVDNAFSNGSLHEWEDPELVINELFRVLRPGGKLFISDLKRNLSPVISGIMELTISGEKMKTGLNSSISAAYRKKELIEMMNKSLFGRFQVSESPFGLKILAEK